MSVNPVELRAQQVGDTLPVSKIPPCDVCAAHGEQEPALYNAMLASGDWLNVCQMDFFLFLGDLGTGKGQKLVQQTGAKPAPKAAYAPEPPPPPPPAPRAAKKAVPQVPTMAEAEARKKAAAAPSNGSQPKKGAARKAAMNKAAPAPAPEPPKAEPAKPLDPDVQAVRDKRAARAAAEQAPAEAEPPAPEGPPPGHVQQPGTKWTPSDPQQKVAPPLHEVIATNLAAEQAAKQGAPAPTPAPAPAEADTTHEGNQE